MRGSQKATTTTTRLFECCVNALGKKRVFIELSSLKCNCINEKASWIVVLGKREKQALVAWWNRSIEHFSLEVSGAGRRREGAHLAEI